MNSQKIDILLLGSGGREHALLAKLAESPRAGKLYVAPGNGGMNAMATPVEDLDIDSPVDVAQWASQRGIGLVVIGPEAPLVAGVADAVRSAGIPCFGPNGDAAQMEGSKKFAKQVMARAGVPTAAYRSFTDEETAAAYVRQVGGPVVVKADGLAAGKGVIVAKTTEEALEGVHECFSGAFGDAGTTVVVEETLEGPECSLLALTDGTTVVPLATSQDHKRALDGDKGPNTGGMGAITPAPCYTPEIAQRCVKEIFEPTMAAMKAEGRPFQGVLYFGLMLTAEGPKVVEYNARFGDPECQALLMRLDTDLMDIFEACVKGTLDQVDIRWKRQAACCLVLASGGYPLSYEKGKVIEGLDQVADAVVFHAGTAEKDGRIVTNGGRVLGVTALGEDLEAAIRNAYQAAQPIHFDQMHFRTDIGHAF